MTERTHAAAKRAQVRYANWVPFGQAVTEEYAPLVKAAREFADAETEYRHTHNIYGNSNLKTGRAWDRMRNAGDQLRITLREIVGEEGEGNG